MELYLAAPTATSSTRSSTPAWPSTTTNLDEDGQVDFKGKAKAFTRTYGFLASILPYSNAEWEKLSIFLNFLIPEAARAQRGGPLEGHPRSHRHGQLPRREAGCHRRSSLPDAGRRDRARARPAAAGASPSRNWIGSPTSSRHSTTSSATSPGRTPTGSASSSPRTSRARWPPTRAYQNAKKNSDKQNARIEHDKALAAS